MRYTTGMEFDDMIEEAGVDPIGQMAEQLIWETDNYLRSFNPTVRAAVPVNPGLLPHGATEMILGWGLADSALIIVLRARYGINEPTARNWIWTTRRRS
jgi:hypothetical protein